MGETENPHFYDFEIFGRVSEPQNQLFLSLETPGYLNWSKKTPNHCSERCFFTNITITEMIFGEISQRGGDQQMGIILFAK